MTEQQDQVVEQVEVEQAQGIIFSGYGHMPHAAFLFFRVRREAEAIRWLRRILPDVLSAAPWPANPDGSKRKPTTGLNVAFSCKGLAALGLPAKTLGTFPLEFILGMADRSEILGDSGDSAPDKWQLGGPANEEIHGVLMLYGTSDHRLEGLIDAQRRELERTHDGIVEVSLERGHRGVNGKEHFGFQDGISQPSILGMRMVPDSQPAVAPGEFLLGYQNEYGFYAEGPAVPEADDPKQLLPSFPDGALDGFKDFGRNGSYLVYRKLEQDVAGFWQFMEKSTDGNSDGRAKQRAMILLAAKFFGRWPSGAPLTVTPNYDSPALANDNNFVYMQLDPSGYRCPIGAHIRRANPRDSRVNDLPVESMKTSSRHRLIRRGITYGPALFDGAALDRGVAPIGLKSDRKARGFHFFALNSDTARQFEFLQQTWCNSATFNAEFETSDPIVGCNDGTAVMTLQALPVRQRIRNVPRFVSVVGGEYFFMPGLPALRYLAKDAA